MMLGQQLDIDGGLHDLAPQHETMRLFTASPQIRGQIALDTDALSAHHDNTIPLERTSMKP